MLNVKCPKMRSFFIQSKRLKRLIHLKWVICQLLVLCLMLLTFFSVFKGLQPIAITKTKQLKQNKSLIWRLESSCPCVLWREREVDLTA